MSYWQFFILVCRACLRREGLAFFAFIAAVGAGAVMTALLAWQVWFLQEHERVDEIANLAYGMLVLIAVTQLSLHRLLGSKQAIEIEFWKLKAKIDQEGQ